MKEVRTIVDAHLILNTEDLGKEAMGELRSEFTKTNPDFYKKQRMGFYTGNIPRQLTSWKQETPWLYLPRGAKAKIEEILHDHGLEIAVIRDNSIHFLSDSDDMSTNMKAYGCLYPYQTEAVNKLAQAGNAVVRGPCGSGKTIVLLGAIAKLNQPTLVIVHSSTLMKQWKLRIIEWLNIIPGSIGGGKKPDIKRITVGMQQTIWKCEDADWLKRFGCIVGDEVHHWAARTFQITAGLFPAAYRIGASADERRKDGLEYMIYETFGPCVHTIKKDELIQLNRLLPIHMELVTTEFYNENYIDSLEEQETPDWANLITRMIRDESRNMIILDNLTRVLAESPNHRILILNDRVEGCQKWFRVLSAAKVPVGLMLGGPEYKEALQESVRDLHTGRIRVGVGTTVAEEGLDIPPLTHVFITCPTHSHLKRMEQMVGRTARVYGNKRAGKVVYFWDRLMWPRDRIAGDNVPRGTREKKFIQATFAKVADSITLID